MLVALHQSSGPLLTDEVDVYITTRTNEYRARLFDLACPHLDCYMINSAPLSQDFAS